MSEPTVIITHPHVHVRDADLSRLDRDALVLTAEERRWGRRRVTTEKGRELALALPTGSALVPGAILHVARDWYVVIEAAAEPVLVVTPRSHEEGLRVAFEDDPAMEQLLERLKVEWRHDHAVFIPLGVAHQH